MKHAPNTGPLIISQMKRRRRNILEENQGLTEEDLEDLAGSRHKPSINSGLFHVKCGEKYKLNNAEYK